MLINLLVHVNYRAIESLCIQDGNGGLAPVFTQNRQFQKIHSTTHRWFLPLKVMCREVIHSLI